MKRRTFLHKSSIAGLSAVWPLTSSCSRPNPGKEDHGKELTADIVIIGGGMGGCAAALAALKQGAKVIMTEPTDWIGGQVTQQGVPPDEHQWVETIGGTSSYTQYRDLVRAYYRQNYPLSTTAANAEFLNPGNGAVSRICHEPTVSLAVLESMLGPFIADGSLKLILNTLPDSAETDKDLITSVTCIDRLTGDLISLKGKIYIDASEEGDLLPLTGTEYVIGTESIKDTGEPHASQEADPTNIQSMTYCFAIDHLDGEDHVIARPEMYDFWKDHVPDMNPPWPGSMLSLTYSFPRTLQPKSLPFIPCTKDEPAPNTKDLNLWLYRRIIDRDNFQRGAYNSDVSLINWPQNDYLLGNITDVDEEERKKHLYQSKQQSLSLLYWLQTEAPRPDGKQGWPGLRLRKDIMGTEDGLAKYPYVRESRRIMAEFTILEQHLSLEERKKAVKDVGNQILATPFQDSVGIGYYHLDLHPSTGGDNYIDMPSVPFQIPMGALIPKRIDNLIPGCKNIGTTHISNGCYRLHPVEWSIGEAAGALAVRSINRNLPPRGIRNNPAELKDFQDLLMNNGVDLHWRL